jgi:hypothetical protein
MLSKEPRLVRRDKATRDEREYGSFYFGVVTSVRNDGRVNVRIPSLGFNIGPVLPINSAILEKDDTVVCAFTDSANSSLIVIGTVNKKIDTDLSARNEKIRFMMEVFNS